MRNAADIQYRYNLMSVFANTFDRIQAGTYYGRETENGLNMALSYLNSLSSEYLTDSELKHAIRLSTYRGAQTDYRKMRTA